MSGGAYDYKYFQLTELAEEMAVIDDEYNDTRNLVVTLLDKLANICHDIEWIDSSDYGNDRWIDIKHQLEELETILKNSNN